MPRPPVRRVAVPCVTLLGLALLGLALACWPSAGAAQEAEKPGAAKRFSPEAHFPAPALVYAGVGNVARLDEKLSGTLPGRILSDPGTQRTFAGLIALVQEQVRQGSGPFVQLTGKSPLEVLGLLRGEVAFCLRGISLAGVPEAVLAVELGKDAEDILGVVARLRAAGRGDGGGAAEEGETASFEGVEANL
ncbi:MAG: hypothetical protein HY721_11270, partial [Planctomycetes bacterium]|nr:hypothetical protein [Planctomycetota bacterium]